MELGDPEAKITSAWTLLAYIALTQRGVKRKKGGLSLREATEDRRPSWLSDEQVREGFAFLTKREGKDPRWIKRVPDSQKYRIHPDVEGELIDEPESAKVYIAC